MSISLGIWLVRAEAEALGTRLQQTLGGTLYRPWLDGVEADYLNTSGMVADMVPEMLQAKTESTTQRTRFALAYRQHTQWIVIAASGLAVRFLDGLTQDKHSDPAVVLVDEAGRFAISLLAGHEGGANQLAYRVANAIGASPVVTTATEALKPLTVGIGCRKGVTMQAIEAAVLLALKQVALKQLALKQGDAGERSMDQVREIATVDIKAEEPGLLAFCQQHGLPLRVLSSKTVAARAWVTQPSAWVRQNTGLDGVCEPCALIASPRGSLIVPKMALNGVAVAVVEDNYL